MTTFEKCESIRSMLINRAAEVIAYKESWSDEFSLKTIRNFPKEVREMNKGEELFNIQPAEMTDEQLTKLGFGKWSNETPMRLIPLWLYPFLADEIETECIDGEKTLAKKSEMDTDNRFGCLAYGVTPKDA